jgi:hypothetical protein
MTRFCAPFLWRPDPGPCPVDDTPHTACCSPDYVGTGRSVIVKPFAAATRVTIPATPLAPPSTTDTPAPRSSTKFTTSTYRRETRQAQAKRNQR